MKKLLFAMPMLALLAGIFSFIPKTKTFADTFTVDVAKSKIDWYGAAADHYHPGVVSLKSGILMVDNGKIIGGKFTIDLTTIKSTDGAGDRLDNTIKSPNFFNVAQFGEATYEITSVNYTSDANADITGNLTVKGTSVPVKFTAKIRGIKDGKMFAEAFFTLDPTAIGIQKYGVDIAVHLFAAK
jgi:polyisoprenoid-binding protein YceI